MAIDSAVAVGFGLVLFSMLRKSMVTVGQLPSGVVVYQETRSTAGPTAWLLIAVAVLAVAFRRRRPVFMLGVLLAGSVASMAFSGADPVRFSGGNLAPLIYFLPIGYVLYLIAATYERTRTAVRVLAAVFGVIAVDVLLLVLDNGRYPARVGMLIPVVLGLIIIWSAGYIVRQRRRYALGLQVEAASKAVAQERLRIARELHDVVAHSMSVIAVQAGFGQYVPADAGAALAAIQATSREALEEMRRMLGVLRQTDETPGGAVMAPLYPAPGLSELDRLLERTRSVGVEVALERRGTPRDLPATVDLSAYRVIQEALTNVVKHARASSCGVLVAYEPGELVIEVTDSGAGVPAMVGAGIVTAPIAGGHGIIGMRERVVLLGGQFSAGPLPGYGFRVDARFPLPPEAG
jgi:signal transduction histidine kinase